MSDFEITLNEAEETEEEDDRPGSEEEGKNSFRFWDKRLVELYGAATLVTNALDQGFDHIQGVREQAYRNYVLAQRDTASWGEVDYSVEIPNMNSDNILLPAGEAVVAAMCSQKYVPMLITENGSFQQREVAKKNNQLLAGAFQKYGVHKLRHELIWDALIEGAGVTKTSHDGTDVIHERHFFRDIFVDPVEARYGWRGVRTLYHRYLVDREELYWTMKARGAEEEELEKLWQYKADPKDTELFGPQTISDMVPFIEAYHLGAGKRPGKYFAGIRGATFLLKDYEKKFFPYSFLYQFHPGGGIRTVPFITQFWPQQKFYDELTESTIQSIKKGGQPRLIVYGDSKPTLMTAGKDQEFAYVKLNQNAKKPETLQFQPINPQVEEYRRSIPDLIIRRAGVPEQWATGKIPAWLEAASGKAQQVAVEEGSKRMEPSFECVEEYIIDVGYKMQDAIREVAKTNKSFKIPIVTGRSREVVKVNDVLLPEEDYALIVHPANVRFRSPAAKFATADEWFEKRAIDMNTWREMQELPDEEAQDEYDLSTERIIKQNLDAIRRDKIPMSVMPTDDFDLVIKYGTAAANAVRRNPKEDPDGEIYMLIVDYIDSAVEEKGKVQAAAMAAQMAAAGLGPGQAPPAIGPQSAAAAPPAQPGPPPMPGEASMGLAPGQMSGQAPTS